MLAFHCIRKGPRARSFATSVVASVQSLSNILAGRISYPIINNIYIKGCLFYNYILYCIHVLLRFYV